MNWTFQLLLILSTSVLLSNFILYKCIPNYPTSRSLSVDSNLIYAKQQWFHLSIKFNIISVLWCIQLSVKPSRHALFILKNETFLIWSENKHNRLLYENRQTLDGLSKVQNRSWLTLVTLVIEKFFISSVKNCPLFSRMTCVLLISYNRLNQLFAVYCWESFTIVWPFALIQCDRLSWSWLLLYFKYDWFLQKIIIAKISNRWRIVS